MISKLGNLLKSTKNIGSTPAASTEPAPWVDTLDPTGGAATTGAAGSAAPPFLERHPAAKVYEKRFGADHYRGELSRGKPHGNGAYSWANKERYIGQWRDGVRHGHGVMYYLDSTYVGDFRDDLRHGHGEEHFANGQRYVGEFKQGLANGQGEAHYADGQRYVGEFKQDRWHGQGEAHYPDGSRKVGRWRQGLLHGQGEWHGPSGSSYIGEFDAGKRSGRGVYTVANGYSYAGRWKDGAFVDPPTLPHPLVAPDHEALLREAAEDGLFITLWVRYLGRDLVFFRARDPAAPPAPPAIPHEVLRTTLERRSMALAELSARGRELVAAVVAPGGELALLAHCPVESQSDITHDYVSRVFTRFPPIETLDRGGKVVAYAYLPLDRDTGAHAQHLLIWDRAERARHQVRALAATDLSKQLVALSRTQGEGEQAGCAGDAQGYLCVIRHPLQAATQERAAAHAAVQRCLQDAQPEAAAAALEAQIALQPAAEHAALRALAAALRQHAAAPWQAYRGLGAAIARPPAGVDEESLRTCLEVCLGQDVRANRLSTVCAAMLQQPVDADTARPLAEAILGACGTSPGIEGETPLAAAIAARSVEATTFVAALGLGAPDAQAQAEATGLPALVAAASGDLEGLRQWERLGPRARNTLQWAAQRAAQQSQAATAALAQRLTTLLGVTPSEVAALRRFIQQADVWVNFKGEADNDLLASATYRPNSAKRDHIERERFAGHYHDGPLPLEEFPKYGWLNTHKVRQGLQDFGDSALVLRPHMQLRTNWVLRDDWATNVGVGTSVSMDHIILRLSDDVLRGLYAASRGERLERLQVITDATRDFVEVQVHGPLDLQQDVRKVVAPTTALASGALPLSRFAQRVQLPLRWRDAGTIDIVQRPRYVAALGQLNLAVAAWTSQGDSDRLLLHPAKKAREGAAAVHYELQSAPAQELLALVNNVGRSQQEVVGLRLDPPNNQVDGRRPFATLLVREAAQPMDYAVRRTAQLGARLRQMEANGLVVCAYAQEAQSTAPLPLHVLVARQAAPGEAFTHMHVSAHRDRLDAVRATQVAAGWTVCGLASSDGETFTLLLHRPMTPPAAQDDPGETTLISGEPLSTVPEALQFRDDANNLFDVDELVELIAHHGVFKNFYTNQALSAAETQRLLNHPSGAGERLRGMQSLQSRWRAAITPEARTRILALAEQLASEDTAGPLTGSTQLVAAFESFAASRDAHEQAALYAGRFALTDTHGEPFSLTVMEALSGLQRGAGCSRATARYLEAMMGESAA